MTAITPTECWKIKGCYKTKLPGRLRNQAE